jgi:superfamily II DNA or RNA helicase
LTSQVNMAESLDDLIKSLSKPVKKRPAVFSKTVLSDLSKRKLLAYQHDHVIKLIGILLRKHIALDASDTGVGKTYIAAGVCLEMRKRPVVLCPKSLIYTWKEVFEYMGVKVYDIVNYETAKTGKTYRNYYCTLRRPSPYLELVDDENEPYRYRWELDDDAIVIFDEVHRCRNPKTTVGTLLKSAKQLKELRIPVLLLSATISEKYEDMQIPCYLFDLIPRGIERGAYKEYIIEARQRHRHELPRLPPRPTKEQRTEYNRNMMALTIHREIKDYCSRIRIKDLGDRFPSNQISYDSYTLDAYQEVAEAYEQLEYHLAALRENPGGRGLAEIVKIKQEIELKKIPIFLEQARIHLDGGKSVIIFVNYLKTMDLLTQELGIRCCVRGGQDIRERDLQIAKFQSGAENIIILQINAGGVGISLHDLKGDRPRVTLLSCPESASSLIQALGRAARAEGKSTVLQRVIFTAGVEYETRQKENIKRKLRNLSGINDDDLDGFKHIERRRRDRK